MHKRLSYSCLFVHWTLLPRALAFACRSAAEEEFSTVTDPVRVRNKAILLLNPFFDVSRSVIGLANVGLISVAFQNPCF